MKPHGRLNPKGVEYQLRLAKAIGMRLPPKCATWQEISDACGWGNRSSAYLAVQKELNRRIQEPTDELVQWELEKLNKIEKKLLPEVLKPNKKQATLVRAEIALMARRAKLRGLDDFERRSIELAERRNALDQQQSTLVYEFMNRVLNRLNLTPEQRALLPDVVPDELAKITLETAPNDMDELEEIEENPS